MLAVFLDGVEVTHRDGDHVEIKLGPHETLTTGTLYRGGAIYYEDPEQFADFANGAVCATRIDATVGVLVASGEVVP